ncbi:hypothetical protein [Quadrisphaera sp. DSM 44207]|uniref:hypothetical protein n=1 Tax=Quadrisphaera sp. DSM 44207 TaxID=1881057 RepID=UPI0008807308|nr:hypothetical protein [Quadrisphaera sp. DSM 44207]SDQ70058.1 hypothetical protein SAMN05428996_2453 [Quadrisphaera sp. DSM 44207]
MHPYREFVERWPSPPPAGQQEDVGHACVDVVLQARAGQGAWQLTEVLLEGQPVADCLRETGAPDAAVRADSLPGAPLTPSPAVLRDLLDDLLARRPVPGLPASRALSGAGKGVPER